MVSKTTLFLSNLPQRPKNKQNYIKALLKCFNPNNEYCDYMNSLPDLRFGSRKDIPLLDKSLGIISISRPQSYRFQNKCYITFDNEDSVIKFIKRFQNMKFMGRCIKIQYSKKRSYMEVYKDNPKLLNKIVKIQKSKKLKKTNDPLNLKRKLRRLRSKLRSKKNLTQEQIDKISEEHKIKLIKSSAASKQNSNKTSKSKKKQSFTELTRQINKPEVSLNKIQNKVNVSENPPNKILLIQDIPTSIEENQLIDIFQCDGFIEVRMVPARHLAFVEYDSIESAKHVLKKVGNTYYINGEKKQQILVGYAK